MAKVCFSLVPCNKPHKVYPSFDKPNNGWEWQVNSE